jgi:hypothetical protein
MVGHLHVEGMDLSGKSTLVDKYIDRSDSNWQIQRGMLKGDSPIRTVVDEIDRRG